MVSVVGGPSWDLSMSTSGTPSPGGSGAGMPLMAVLALRRLDGSLVDMDHICKRKLQANTSGMI